MVSRLLPPHQRKLSAVDAGQWLLNALSCMVWSEALQKWFGSVPAIKPGRHGHSQGSNSGDSIRGDRHMHWEITQSLKSNKMPVSGLSRLICSGVSTYSGRRVLASSYVHANFSGQTHHCERSRVVSIESFRGQSMCEMALEVFLMCHLPWSPNALIFPLRKEEKVVIFEESWARKKESSLQGSPLMISNKRHTHLLEISYWLETAADRSDQINHNNTVS